MRIAAFSDCHIGSYAKRTDESSALNSRLLDTVQSLEFVIMDANKRNVDLILMGGDLFRNHKPTPTELVLVSNALREADAPIYAIPGNHDLPRAANEHNALEPIFGQNAFNTPQLLRYFDVQIATLPYPNRAQLAATLDGYDKLSPQDADDLISAHMQQILRGLAAQLDPKLPSVLLSHISLDVAEPGAERGIMAGRDIVIPLSAIPEEFTFTALGHVHYAQDFGSFGRPNVFYCGSTDRIDFGEENQFKSYVIMDTEAGTWDRVAIPCREYVTVPVVFEEGEFRVGSDLENVKDSICRLTYQRPDNEKPDYPWFEQMVWNAGAWDYRGYSEDVQRVASIRSEEIVHAVSVGELIRVWHSSKSSDAPLDELVAAGEELERTCAV